MAGAGYRNWTAGDVPTADQFDTFLQEQTVMVFASAAARDTALSVPKAEGMVAYLLDTNRFTVYTGSAWSTVGPVHGAPTAWTPTVSQPGAVTVTVSRASYWRVGRLVTCEMYLAVTGAGSAGNAVIIGGLPAAMVASNALAWGSGFLFDASTGIFFQWLSVAESSTTVALFGTASAAPTNPRLGVTGFTVGLASGDLIVGGFSYEAAADA